MIEPFVLEGIDGRVTWRVLGDPKSKGNLRANPKGIGLYEVQTTESRAWRKALAQTAVYAWRGRAPLEGGVSVELRFYLPRPASVPKAKRSVPMVKPDIDKLERAVLDELTRARVWRDDAQVVELHTFKSYADSGPNGPGVKITVGEI